MTTKQVTMLELFKRALPAQGPLNKKTGEFYAPHSFLVDLPERDELLIVPEGTEIQLWQDPNPPGGHLRQGTSVGTIFLPHAQFSLRGDGSLGYSDLGRRRDRALCSLGASGRKRGHHSMVESRD